jgi:hypothetical protein
MNTIEMQAIAGLPFLFVRRVPAWAELYSDFAGVTLLARFRSDPEGSVALELSSSANTSVFEPVQEFLVLRCAAVATAGLSGRYLFDVEMSYGGVRTVIFGGAVTFVAAAPAFVPRFLPSISQGEMEHQVLGLWPRGRAWQTSPADVTEDTTQSRFRRAVAEVMLAAQSFFDGLRPEMFSGSATATRDDWLADFDLPDPCDPFPSLQVKAVSLGDTTPAYAATAAAYRGWSVFIVEEAIPLSCSSHAGGAQAGFALPGADAGVAWRVMIDVANSPVTINSVPLAGRMLAGQGLGCPIDTSSLDCVMRRMAPAHADLIYQEI